MSVPVELPDELARRLQAEASRRATTVDEVVADLVGTLPAEGDQLERDLPVDVLRGRARPLPSRADFAIPGLEADELEAFLRAIER